MIRTFRSSIISPYISDDYTRCLFKNSIIYFRAKEDLSTIQWVYPVFGIPLEAPLKELTLGVVQCEVGSQLEKKVDLKLTGCVPGNRDQSKQEGVLILFSLESFK